jgi:hypothetical protein
MACAERRSVRVQRPLVRVLVVWVVVLAVLYLVQEYFS